MTPKTRTQLKPAVLAAGVTAFLLSALMFDSHFPVIGYIFAALSGSNLAFWIYLQAQGKRNG